MQGGESTPAPDRGAVLQQVVEQIDADAGLVRPLKMFAYRGTPPPAAVGRHEAVRHAWAGSGGALQVHLERHRGSGKLALGKGPSGGQGFLLQWPGA